MESDNSSNDDYAKEGDVITVTVLSDQAWPLDTSTISMTITGLSPQPTLSFSETSTSPYTYTANFTYCLWIPTPMAVLVLLSRPPIRYPLPR